MLRNEMYRDDLKSLPLNEIAKKNSPNEFKKWNQNKQKKTTEKNEKWWEPKKEDWLRESE